MLTKTTYSNSLSAYFGAVFIWRICLLVEEILKMLANILHPGPIT